jgi:hypothetical protein
MKVVDPPHGFHIADCSQVTLGCGKILMPEDPFVLGFTGVPPGMYRWRHET